MRYIDDAGSVNLSNVKVHGGLETMPVGTYRGIFVGRTLDAEDQPWVTVSTTNQTHIEQTDIKVPDIEPGQPISFTISTSAGAIAMMNGQQYKLFDARTKTDITEYMPIPELYRYIKQHGIELANPVITKLEAIDVK